MNLHQILKTVPPEYHAIARHYTRPLDTAGVLSAFRKEAERSVWRIMSRR